MNELAKTPLRQVQNIKQLLMNDQAKAQLQMVAAKHMNPERMMRVVANAIRTTPKLQTCEPISFLGALMQCASLGLEPNTVMGHAYLIPFDNKRKGVTEVQVVIGYKGLIDLARRSGHITNISANIHYDDDDLWDYEEGTEAKLRHRPGPQEGNKLHAYAIAQFRDGGHAYVVLPWKHVMRIRDASQNWQGAVRYGKTAQSIWALHEDAMAMKTAVRALSKYLPLSVEFSDAVSVDESKGADYRAFAMDPTGGVQFDGDEIEGEAIDADPVDEEEPKPTTISQRAAATGPAQDKAPAQTSTAADKAMEAEAARVAEKRAADDAKAKAQGEAKQAAADKKAKQEEAQAQAQAQAQAAAKAADATEETQDEPASNIATDDASLTKYFDNILADLLDNIDVSEVQKTHAERIAAIEAHSPELYAALMDEIAAA
jgi:recombination protein RecT